MTFDAQVHVSVGEAKSFTDPQTAHPKEARPRCAPAAKLALPEASGLPLAANHSIGFSPIFGGIDGNHGIERSLTLLVLQHLELVQERIEGLESLNGCSLRLCGLGLRPLRRSNSLLPPWEIR